MLEWLTDLFVPGKALGLIAYSPPGWGGNLLLGLYHSVQVAIGAYFIGLSIGVLGAFGKLYGSPTIRDLLAIYTTIVRAVPELVLILILYYAIPQVINDALTASGYERVNVPPLLVGTLVLGVVMGAYMTEVLRGAILAVPHGQLEAATAFGMPVLTIAWRIILPQMMANAIPGMANLWLNATKDTALLAVIGFNELTLITKQATGATKAYFLFFFAAAALYMVLSAASGRLFSFIEKWARKGQPPKKGRGI
jgi:polar amino acid transport system permease protein